MTIPTLPTAPSRGSSPDTFATAADAWVAALPAWTIAVNALAAQATIDAATATTQAGISSTQAGNSATSAAAALVSQNAAAASALTALNAPGTTATSTTSTLTGTGTKTITIQTGKTIVAGMQVMIADATAPAENLMRGTVTAYTTGTGVLVVSVDYAVGSSTLANWVVSLTGAMDPTRAPILSPALTGTPTAPTAAPGTQTTQIATTSFVSVAISPLFFYQLGAI